MSNLTAKLSHAANIASWKVNQQLRLNTTNNQIGVLEGQIRAEKIKLAELVLELLGAGQLSAEGLQDAVTSIETLKAECENKKRELDGIKNETPPTAPAAPRPAIIESTANIIQENSSGLVCPNCHGHVPVRFCENCGAEGVLQTN